MCLEEPESIAGVRLSADSCFVSHVRGIKFRSVLRFPVLLLQDATVLQNTVPGVKLKLPSAFVERQVKGSQWADEEETWFVACLSAACDGVTAAALSRPCSLCYVEGCTPLYSAVCVLLCHPRAVRNDWLTADVGCSAPAFLVLLVPVACIGDCDSFVSAIFRTDVLAMRNTHPCCRTLSCRVQPRHVARSCFFFKSEVWSQNGRCFL